MKRAEIAAALAKTERAIADIVGSEKPLTPPGWLGEDVDDDVYLDVEVAQALDRHTRMMLAVMRIGDYNRARLIMLAIQSLHLAVRAADVDRKVIGIGDEDPILDYRPEWMVSQDSTSYLWDAVHYHS